MGQSTIQTLTSRFNQVAALPSGAAFTLTVTDAEATAAAEEALTLYKADLDRLLQGAVGTVLDISEPKAKFENGKVILSAKAGKGFLKVTAEVTASLRWDGSALDVNVESVKLPIVTLDSATANAYIKGPVNTAVNQVLKYYTVQSLTIENGTITIDALRK